MATKEWKITNREKMRKYRREWYERNKDSERKKARIRSAAYRSSDEGKQRLIELRIWYANLKESIGCSRCSEREPVCLDFHHKIASEKIKNVGEMIGFKSSKRIILAEIAKCELLCANCHRKETHLPRSFNGQDESLRNFK